MKFKYRNTGTCSSGIIFDINNGIVTNVEFIGGCNGNLKAIAKLVDNMSAEEIARKLIGNRCGMKNTSCADQLAKAVLFASAKERGLT